METPPNDTIEASNDEMLFSFSIPLEQETIDGHLSAYKTRNEKPEDQSIPREDIAKAVRSFRLKAELGRPLHLGTYKGQPAILIRPRFTFHGHAAKWRTRIQWAEIEISFEDAPYEMNQPDDSISTPFVDPIPSIAVAAFSEKAYKGPWERGILTTSTNIGISLAVVPNFLNVGSGMRKEYTRVVQGALHVQGIIMGQTVTWMLQENEVLQDGIPSTMKLPLIIVPAEGQRRFSAKVTVNAHYGLWRDQLAKRIPVLGRKDEPLYFDPMILKEKVEAGKKEIVDDLGEFTVDLDAEAVQSFS